MIIDITLEHIEIVQIYIQHRSQIHDVVRKTTKRQKENDALRYNREIRRVKHSFENYVMLYQKNIDKLKSRWRELYVVSNYKELHELSFTLTQLDKRDVKKVYHENHFKRFQLKYEYLVKNEVLDNSDAKYQSVRRSRRVKNRDIVEI